MYLEVMGAKVEQERKEQHKHIQQVTNQNARTKEKDQGAHDIKQNPAWQKDSCRQQGAARRKKNWKEWTAGKEKEMLQQLQELGLSQ